MFVHMNGPVTIDLLASNRRMRVKDRLKTDRGLVGMSDSELSPVRSALMSVLSWSHATLNYHA